MAARPTLRALAQATNLDSRPAIAPGIREVRPPTAFDCEFDLMDDSSVGAELDDELADRWEHQQLGGTGISHIDHVRVAWVLHRRHGASEAEERLVVGTKRSCDHYGVPEKFDERLTRRWARAVSAAADAAAETEPFDVFLARHPELRKGDLLGKPHESRAG